MKRKVLLSLSLPLLLSGCGNEPIAPAEGISPGAMELSDTTEFVESDACSALGEQRILVIPCRFQGEREFTDGDLSTLEQAFFAEELSSAKGYFSVKEFYSKSSLGKLSFSGEVAPVVDVPYTVKELEEEGDYLPGVPAEIYSKLDSVSSSFLSSYDLDQDGYVDNAVFVYSSPRSERGGNFWAWVANFATDPNKERPSFNHHMWVGIDFFSSEQYEVDAHTAIHETGHLLGLRDYYPSDSYNLALGGHSMMDYNISDHDPYSKMLLRWADPLYYDFSSYSSLTVSLLPFQTSNQFLLFNPSWNHSALDEYLLFEFYTPDGINAPDAEKRYGSRPLGFTKPGIKVYHVDSRVAKCHYSSQQYAWLFSEYVESIPSSYPEDEMYVIGACNSNEGSRTDASRQGRYKQIALVENKEFNRLQTGESADDGSLFYQGDEFSSSSSPYFLRGEWNSKEAINLTMKVDEISPEKATITLTYQGGSL